MKQFKITIFILLIFFKSINAQDEIILKTFSLPSYTTILSSLFNEIKEQTGIQFAYSNVITLNKTEIKFHKRENLNIKDILEILKDSLNIDYKIIGGNICLIQNDGEKKNSDNIQYNRFFPSGLNLNTNENNIQTGYRQIQDYKGMTNISSIQSRNYNISPKQMNPNIHGNLYPNDSTTKMIFTGENDKRFNIRLKTGIYYHYIRHDVKGVDKLFPTIGFHAGLIVEKRLNNRFSTSVYCGYIYQSKKNDYSNPMPSFSDSLENYEWAQVGFIADMDNLLGISHHYLDIALLVGFNIIDKMKISLGPGYSYCISVNENTDRLAIDYLSDLYGHHYRTILEIVYDLSVKIKARVDYNYGLDQLIGFDYSKKDWSLKESFVGISLDFNLF